MGCGDRPIGKDGKRIYIGYNIFHNYKNNMIKYKNVIDWLNSQTDPDHKSLTTYKSDQRSESMKHFLDNLLPPYIDKSKPQYLI